MPFTTSHPAAVIPLKHLWPRYFSLTGLIAGAMSPDFIYFILLRTAERGISHSWDGLFLFCLPAGVLFSFLFHWFFKEEFIAHLPRFLKKRMEWLLEIPWRPSGLREWIVLIVSILVGSLSHFFWDSWTHGAGELTVILPWLLSWIPVLGFKMQVFRLLTHISTFVGAYFVLKLLLGGQFQNYSPERSPDKSLRQILLFQVGGLLSSLALMAIVAKLHWCNPGSGLDSFYGYRFSFITAGLASWTGYISFVCVRGGMRLLAKKREAIPQEN